MPPRADRNRPRHGMRERESYMHRRKMLQVRGPVVTSVSSVAIVLVGTQAILEIRERLPGELAGRFDASALESCLNELRRLFWLLVVVPVEDHRRDAVPDV